MSRKATDQVTTIYSDGTDGLGWALINHTKPKTTNVRAVSQARARSASYSGLDAGDEPTLRLDRRQCSAGLTWPRWPLSFSFAPSTGIRRDLDCAGLLPSNA